MNTPLLDRTQLNDKGNSFAFHDKATATKDCNVAKVSEVIEYVNGHQLSALQTRTAGGALTGPTGTALAVEVFRSEGLVAGKDYATFRRKPTADTTRKLLYLGWYVVGFVHYGTVNTVGLPSGDRQFTGAHALGLWGWRRSPAGILVWDHDPLFDGRRPAIPFGRQHVRLALVEAALGAYAGAGLVSGYAVRIPL